MKREVLKTYRLIIYTDGSTELIPDQVDIEHSDSEITTPNTKYSQRIFQICSVLKETITLLSANPSAIHMSLISFDRLVSTAISNVARLNQIATPTVMDKCTRQLGINKSLFSELIYETMNQSDYTQTQLYTIIKEHLLNIEDLTLVDETFTLLSDFAKRKN